MTDKVYTRLQRPSRLDGVEIIDDVHSLKSAIVENMQMCGINEERSDYLGDYLAGAYLARLPVLFYGKNVQQMTNAFAVVMSGMVPPVLEFPANFDDYAGLLAAINEQGSYVIVLHNSIGSIPESMLIRLMADIPDHYILFSADSAAYIQYMPPGLLSYIGLVKCDAFVDTAMRVFTPFKVGNLRLPADIYEYGSEEFDKNYAKIHTYSQFANLENGYVMSRTIMITLLNAASTLYTIGIPDTIGTPETIIGELTFYAELSHNVKGFMTNVLDGRNEMVKTLVERYLE